MECHVIGAGRCCLDKQVAWSAWKNRKLDQEIIHRLQCTPRTSRMGHRRLAHFHCSFIRKQPIRPILWKICAMHITLEEESSSLKSEDNSSFDDDEHERSDSSEDHLTQPLSSNELKSLLADSERAKLIRKLSEANQQNRFLKRQLYIKEDALVNFKSELAVMEVEMLALSKMAEEIVQYDIPQGSRKINGKYIQSHLLSQIEALHKKLKEQIKDVDAAKSKEVALFWIGMAESVQVMGTFDGWSQGEHLSPDYTGSFTKFSTTLMLRPGRYEIKFLIDGEWQLSPELPTVVLLVRV